ncbi:MAG TPA: alcohol dehydrogenase catalytic domain-containing protein, partial [Chthoniobacteraceae bacterium]|nr:alcohol dehydrogenase catalytic domain-containing protein [Chthoniobacteraceae bacterium]
MKTLLYPEFDRVEVAESAVPAVARGEVLLKVAACGICGSELEGFRKRSPRRPPPLVMGHEFCGVVAELGGGVANVSAGQKVVSNSLVSCGNCVRCQRGDTHLCAQRQIFGMHRPGAFAEFVSVPAQCLISWPDALPAEAACLAEPLGNGVHIVNLTRHLASRSVLVIGGGPIGLMTQQAFQAISGATVFVSDPVPARRDAATKLGAKRVIDPASEDVVKIARELTEGEGVDLVVDAVGGAATKQQSLAAARPGGAAVWIGLHENA